MAVKGRRVMGPAAVSICHSCGCNCLTARSWARVMGGGAVVRGKRTNGPFRSATVLGCWGVMGSRRLVSGRFRSMRSPVFQRSTLFDCSLTIESCVQESLYRRRDDRCHQKPTE